MCVLKIRVHFIHDNKLHYEKLLSKQEIGEITEKWHLIIFSFLSSNVHLSNFDPL